MRGWRPRPDAVAVITVLALVLCVVGVWQTSRPVGTPVDQSSGVVPLLASINSQTIKACSAVTTCTTTGIATVAYSAVYVFMSAKTGTAPSGWSDSAAHTFVSDANIAQSTNTEAYWKHVDNVSATGSLTVTITFASSSTYTISVLDIAKVQVTSKDAVGAGSTSTGSGTASNAVTTTIANDLVLLGVAEGSANSMSASGSDVVVQQVAAGTSQGADLSQTVAATGAVTLSATFTSAAWAAIAIAIKPAGVPVAPVSLAAGTVTTTTVPLTWAKGASAGPNVNMTVYQAAYASGACGAYSTKYSAGTVNSFTVTGLTTRNAYCFKVTQWNATGEGAASTAITNIQTANAPLAETGLTVTPVGGSTTSLMVGWSDAAGNTGLVNYTVYRTTGASCTGTPTTVNFGGNPPLTLFANGLTANSQYGFTVQAWNATGASVQSSCVSATTYAVPGTPTGLGVTATTATTVGLAWTNPGGTLVNDTVLSGSSCGTWTSQTSTGIASSYTVTGLAPFTSYCFAVQAWNAGGVGSASGTQSVTTLTVPPAAPTSVASSAQTTTTVTLTWVQPSTASGSLVNDTVNVGTTCGTWTTRASTGGGVSSFQVTGLTAGTTYCFAVSAWTQAGQGSLSATLSVATLNSAPTAPTSLTYLSASRTAITVNWTLPAGVVINTTVYYKLGASCPGGTGISSGIASTWTISGLVASTNYAVTVTAWTNGGQSAQATCLQTGTKGAAPQAPEYVNSSTVASTWVTLSWANPSGYTIFNNSIYVKATTCGPAWTTVISTGGVVTSYNVTGLLAGTTYCIEVTSWDDESPPSDPIWIQTASTDGSGGIGGGGGGGGYNPPTQTLLPKNNSTGPVSASPIGPALTVIGVGVSFLGALLLARLRTPLGLAVGAVSVIAGPAILILQGVRVLPAPW